MLGTFKFYFLYIIVMTMSLALLSSSELYKEIAKETILDDHVSTACFLHVFARFAAFIGHVTVSGLTLH